MIDGVTRRGSSPVFVGRRRELARLEDAYARAAGGQPSCILVAGDAGVGKSRLVAEFIDQVEAAGGETLIGGCLDLGEGGLPYAPFVEALRALARRMDPAAREVVFGPSADVLGALIPDLRQPGVRIERADPSDAAGRLARLFDAVIAVLGRLSQEQPVALILEDIHWADGSTRDLIRFLVRNLRDERLLVLTTYRSDDLHRRHPLMPLLGELERADLVERLELRPFERDELSEQLTGILGETPSPLLVDLLLDRSDGLPFYVEELIGRDEVNDSALPSTLRDILGLRLATLSPGSLALVHAAAVIGGRFPHERLAATFGRDEDELVAALHEAIDARILVPIDDRDGPAYHFRHALLREAAYDELLPAERVRLHARLADHLEASIRSITVPDPSIVADYALHAYQAHDQPRALAGSVKALVALVGATAYREALGHAERAIELWPLVDDARETAGIEHADLLALAARIASATNQPARATALLQDALLERTTEVDRGRRAELLATLYELAWEAEQFETSAAAAEEAYELVETAEASRSKAFVLVTLGWHRWWQHRLRESLRLCEEAAAMSEDLGDHSGWTIAVSSAAHTLADLGWVTRAAANVDRMMQRGAAVDERFESIAAHIDRSLALWTAGRFAEAARIAEVGLARATRYGWEPRLGSGFRGCLADAYFELGRYEDVQAVTTAGIAGDGIHHTITWAALTMARAAVAQGRLDDAHRLTDDLQRDPAMDEGWYALSIVELARADGRFDAVVSGVERAIAHVVGTDLVIPLPMVFGAGIGAAADEAAASRRRRRRAEASEAAVQAARWLGLFRSLVKSAKAEGGAGPFIDALLATAEAEMPRLEGHSDPIAWSAAVGRWTDLEHRHQEAYARMRLVEAILDSNGDRASATPALREAHITASLLRAEPLQAEIEDLARRGRIELRDAGVAVAVGRSHGHDEETGPTVVLTARESDVLRLVAAGQTNREIGDRLFISEKTVSVHVSNAMAKLGALSRYEAAAAAEKQGLL